MNIKKHFPFIMHNPDYIYFDSAATSLKPQVVIDAEVEFLQHNGTSPHASDYVFGFDGVQKTTAVRAKLATFIHALQAEEIVFTSGTTHSINLLAHGLQHILQPGDEILLTELEHAANMLPWITLANTTQAIVKKIPLLDNFEIDRSWLAANISGKTKILTFSHITNTLGNRNDVQKIVQIAKQANPDLLVHVDCAQSIAHEPIDVQQMQADFISWSAHKMYGPFGLGCLWGKYKLLDTLTPLIYGGGMSTKVTPNLSSFTLNVLPNKLEGGTPNIAAIYAYDKALDFINMIGLKNISTHETKLKQYFRAKLQTVKLNPQLTFYNLEFDTPLVLFNLHGANPQDVTAFLDKKYRIGARGGAACARRIAGAIRESIAIRISFAIYNTTEEIDQLVVALADIDNFLETII